MIELNKVYTEDCLLTMARMPDNFVDLTVTSPPYDQLRFYDGNILQWNEQKWKDIIVELFRVTKQGGIVVWVVGDATIKGSETGTSFKQALWAKEQGFNLHDTMIYEKSTSPFPMHTRCNQLFEYMFVFSKGSPKTFNPIKIPTITGGQKKSKDGGYRQKDGTTKLAGYETRKITKTIGNIWRYSVGGKRNKHPAVFPEKLAHDHIISWSRPGDVVFDCFAGSGTTGIVAKRLNRNFILSEISSEYCDIIKERFRLEFGEMEL